MYDFARSLDLAQALAPLWSWQEGIALVAMLVLVLGWVTWVEVVLARPTVQFLLVLRILQYRSTTAFALSFCFILGLCASVLGLSAEVYAVLSIVSVTVGVSLLFTREWCWYRLLPPERQRLYDEAALMGRFPEWRQSFFLERPGWGEQQRLRFSAEVTVRKRWLGWTGLLVSLLLIPPTVALGFAGTNLALAPLLGSGILAMATMAMNPRLPRRR